MNPQRQGVLVTVIAIAASVHDQKLTFAIQHRLNSVPGTRLIIHALTAIGHERTHILRVDRLTGRSHHDDKPLLMQRHKRLATQRVALKKRKVQRQRHRLADEDIDQGAGVIAQCFDRRQVVMALGAPRVDGK